MIAKQTEHNAQPTLNAVLVEECKLNASWETAKQFP